MRIVYNHEDLIDIFGDVSPFNMKRDIKYLNKKHISLDKILQEIEATLIRRNYDVIYEKISCNESKKSIVLIKVRIKNPQNHRGESSGFRIIAIVNECDDYALIINLYPKDGSNRKDDLTPDEEVKAKEMYNEHIN